MSVKLAQVAPIVLKSSSPVEIGRFAAERGLAGGHQFISDPSNLAVIACALRIRAVENTLLDLFGKGKLHGTIHTCIGQEFSGAILSQYLQSNDFITSNHRCHGHFVAATGNWRGLIDEIIGNHDGVCAGIGSSQHLWAENFISNGQQGGLLPVAAGVALDRKQAGGTAAVISFMGEGTLGEGIVYETLNLDKLWDLPHVIICENNFYSQSTAQEHSVSGSIEDRAASFSIAVASADTWDLPAFDRLLGAAIQRARVQRQPTFITLRTYRLNPHSKGDDGRDQNEIAWFRAHDPATLAIEDYHQYGTLYREYLSEAADYASLALSKPELEARHYFGDQLPAVNTGTALWSPVGNSPVADQRISQQLNVLFKDWLTRDKTSFFLGEDIEDPYSGAFKVAKGLSSSFGDRVRGTPISEAAIVGIGIGLAISGRRAFVEVMFGDFITYAFDQIINNASKFYHIYNKHIDCPVIVRTPMGGRRGYGPTHSQSLERFLIGIDNCCTISLNSLVDVTVQLAKLQNLRCPVILLENKADYTNKTFASAEGFVVSTDHATLPTLRVHPGRSRPAVTLVSYGGMARFIADRMVEIFERTDTVPELLAPTCLFPLNLDPIIESVRRTSRLVVVEEGGGFASLGAELIAQLQERGSVAFVAARVSGKAMPVPSAPALESAVLPSIDEICGSIENLVKRRP